MLSVSPCISLVGTSSAEWCDTSAHIQIIPHCKFTTPLNPFHSLRSNHDTLSHDSLRGNEPKSCQKRTLSPQRSLSGTATEHYRLGFMNAYGYKTKINIRRAIYHFRQAILVGQDPRAILELGTLYSKREVPNHDCLTSRRVALFLARSAIALGFEEAHYLLWVMYDDHLDPDQSSRKKCDQIAVESFQIAHRTYLGSLEEHLKQQSHQKEFCEPIELIYFRLGCLYDFNTQSALGSDEETERASVYFYEKSGLPTALNNLGCMYKRLSGVFQISEKEMLSNAFRLFQIASKSSFSRSNHNLGNMYLNELVSWEPRTDEERIRTACDYFKLAASQGLSSAYCDLGDIYREFGLSVFRLSASETDRKACSYYVKGAEMENLFCLKYLSLVCLDGVHHSHLWKNNSERFQKAFMWAFKAHLLEPHNKTICEILATCLLEGPTDWLCVSNDDRIRMAYLFLLRSYASSHFVQRAINYIRLLHPEICNVCLNDSFVDDSESESESEDEDDNDEDDEDDEGEGDDENDDEQELVFSDQNDE